MHRAKADKAATGCLDNCIGKPLRRRRRKTLQLPWGYTGSISAENGNTRILGPAQTLNHPRRTNLNFHARKTRLANRTTIAYLSVIEFRPDDLARR
jgi:hypothetical protein